MTRKYWLGILTTILGIFLVGLMIKSGVQRGKDLFTSTFPASLPLMMDAGFRLDGDHLGEIQRLQFLRSRPGMVDSAVVTVKLGDSSDASHFDGCALRVTNGEPFNGHTRFLCTSSDDSARLGLVRFGHVVVLPEGRTVALYVPRDAADQMHEHAYRGTGSGDAGDVDIHVGNDSFSIKVNGHELVHADGHGDGGSLVIRGADGHPIVQINGDSGSVKISDAQGHTRVNIHGSNVAHHGADSGH